MLIVIPGFILHVVLEVQGKLQGVLDPSLSVGTLQLWI